jgi:hypothetical protein
MFLGSVTERSAPCTLIPKLARIPTCFLVSRGCLEGGTPDTGGLLAIIHVFLDHLEHLPLIDGFGTLMLNILGLLIQMLALMA